MEGNQISMAKLGAKLNYVQTLRGECPEGYEVEKYMAGGCVKCKKKAAEGTKVVDIFKEKCGGKAKKRVKKNMGGTVDNSWSVPKDQKGAVVNKADTVHTSKGVYNVSNKKLPYKKLSKEDYQKLPYKDKVKVDLKDQENGRGGEGAHVVKPYLFSTRYDTARHTTDANHKSRSTLKKREHTRSIPRIKPMDKP